MSGVLLAVVLAAAGYVLVKYVLEVSNSGMAAGVIFAVCAVNLEHAAERGRHGCRSIAAAGSDTRGGIFRGQRQLT